MDQRGNFLKDKAERFLENAYELFKKEQYDLCAFNVEQAIQLFLKYKLWEELGDFEKTHQISKLLKDLEEISKEPQKITSLIEKYKEVIADLEVAYIESRYLPVRFFKEQTKKMLDFAEKLREFLGLK